MPGTPTTVRETMIHASEGISTMARDLSMFASRDEAESEAIVHDVLLLLPLLKIKALTSYQSTEEYFIAGHRQLCSITQQVVPAEFKGRFAASLHEAVRLFASWSIYKILSIIEPTDQNWRGAQQRLDQFCAMDFFEASRFVEPHRVKLLDFAKSLRPINGEAASAMLKMELAAAAKSMPPVATKLKAPIVGEPPAEFREGGRSNGEPLCFPYLADNDWHFNRSFICKKFAKGVLTKRHPIGNKHAYLFTELAALRRNKSEEEDENY